MVAFQWSFSPMGITTSLVSVMPRRETCTHSPFDEFVPSVESNVVTLLRLAEAYTPITKLGSNMLVAALTFLPSFCRLAIGTSIHIVWQLNLARPSGPGCLKLPTSNAPPRSTKNGSSIGPQQTRSPLCALAI